MRSRSIPTLSRFHPRIPLRRQINPMRIPSDDQSNLLRPRPALQLLLAVERLVNFVVRFPIEQSDDVVAMSEAFKVMEFVLEHPAMQISADPDVERTRDAAHDIHAVIFSVSGH